MNFDDVSSWEHLLLITGISTVAIASFNGGETMKILERTFESFSKQVYFVDLFLPIAMCCLRGRSHHSRGR